MDQNRTFYPGFIWKKYYDLYEKYSKTLLAIIEENDDARKKVLLDHRPPQNRPALNTVHTAPPPKKPHLSWAGTPILHIRLSAILTILAELSIPLLGLAVILMAATMGESPIGTELLILSIAMFLPGFLAFGFSFSKGKPWIKLVTDYVEWKQKYAEWEKEHDAWKEDFNRAYHAAALTEKVPEYLKQYDTFEWNIAQANAVIYEKIIELEKELVAQIVPILDELEKALAELEIEYATIPWEVVAINYAQECDNKSPDDEDPPIDWAKNINAEKEASEKLLAYYRQLAKEISYD